jgi:hypothetical protein
MKHFCHWLEHSSLSATIQNVAWIIPAAQSLHILCIAVVLTSMLMFNLRLLGWIGRDVSVGPLARRYLPPVWIALVGLLVTGVILIIGEPARELLNTVFRLKMLMLLGVVSITLVLAGRARGQSTYWERSRSRRRAAVTLAAVSVVLWCAILTAGRWIAYTTDL